jgi:riboflavin synthase
VFTGIVEERGTVLALEDHRLVVGSTVVTNGTEVGSSISVNGVCLTVIDMAAGSPSSSPSSTSSLSFDLSEETLARTSLRRLEVGAPVNLERPVTLAARLGGHMVQGHVDGVGEIVEIVPEPDGAGARVRIRIPGALLRYAVEKGSVAVDGVSLTVADLADDCISVALVPHTLAVTSFGVARAGDPVNIEVDVIAKYVERLLEGWRT